MDIPLYKIVKKSHAGADEKCNYQKHDFKDENQRQEMPLDSESFPFQ